MKHMTGTFILAWTFLFAFVLAPDHAAGHGTDYRLRDSDAAVVVEFIYSDGKPIPYAETLVFSPEADEIEHQNGRTDKNGRFAFYPDSEGEWRIAVDDGTGHLERVTIEVTSGETANAKVTDAADVSGAHTHNHRKEGLPRFWGIILGLSLIANLFLGFYLVKAKRP